MNPFRRKFRLPAAPARVDGAVDEELRFHIEGRIADLMQRGMTRPQAEAEAARLFGNYDEYRKATRDIDQTSIGRAHRTEWFDAIQRESVHAFRALAKTPAFAAIVFLTLALGIGATTAIYTMVEGVLLRPLPYRGADELVSVMHPTAAPGSGERKWGLSSAGYFHFKTHARTLADISVYRTGSLSVAEPGSVAVEARLAHVTSSVFTVLRAKPALGRLITDADDQPKGSMDRAVLSHEFWRSYFGGDSSVVGRSIETAAGRLQIIGVAEPKLSLPMPGSFSSSADLASFGVDLWVPLNLDPKARPQNNHAFSGLARLAPGATVVASQIELDALTKQFPELFPEAYSKNFMETYKFRVSATPLLDEVVGNTVGKAMWIVFGAAGLVLLIACANVANLFLVRMESRRRESAMRRALGADARHMAVHHLTESLLLTVASGAAGLVVARLAITGILAAAPRSLPRLATIDVHWTSIAFAMTLSIIAGVVFGLLPVVRSRIDVATLREGARGLTASRNQRMVRNGLVVGQVALALMLLAGAGLMIRSFLELRNVRPGIDPAGVLTVSVSLPYRAYETMSAAATFHRQFAERVGGIPGVVAVGGGSGLPLRDYGTGCSVVFREKRPYSKEEGVPCVQTVPAIPGFFAALGITVEGRVPEWSDVTSKTQAVVVTKALADRLWPGEDAIGKGIGINGPDSPWWYRVVGVIPELRGGGLDQSPTEAVFLAASPLHPNQERWGMLNGVEYVIRVANGDPLSLIKPIRAILTEMDPRIPLENPVTMQTIVDRSMARTSFIMLLLGCAAAMALVLSAVGMYGVMSFLVAQRRGEIGVRIALGSPVARVLQLVVGQSARLALMGLALGLIGAFAGTRLMRSILFGVSPLDPLVLAVVPIVLLAIALLAAYGPARRAARVDPIEALRG